MITHIHRDDRQEHDCEYSCDKGGPLSPSGCDYGAMVKIPGFNLPDDFIARPRAIGRPAGAQPIRCGVIGFIPLSFELVDCRLLPAMDATTGIQGLAVEVTVRVIDRSTNRGELLLLTRSALIPPFMAGETYFEKENFLKSARFGAFVRECVSWMMMHELDECLHVNGERLNDPHAEPPSKLGREQKADRHTCAAVVGSCAACEGQSK